MHYINNYILVHAYNENKTRQFATFKALCIKRNIFFGYILSMEKTLIFSTQLYIFDWLVWFMVFSATLSNISVILWRSVLLVEEIGVSGENHRPAASHWQTLSHNVVSSTPRLSGVRTHNVRGDKHWLHSISLKWETESYICYERTW